MSYAFTKSIKRLVSKEKEHASICQDESHGVDAQTLSFLEAMGDGVSLHSGSGKLIWASSKALNLLGSRDAHLADYNFLEQVNPQDQILVLQMINSCFQEEAVDPVRIRKLCTDETGAVKTCVYECRASLRKAINQDDENLVILMTRDVGEQEAHTQYSAPENSSNGEVNQVQRSFVSNVSHELRTPLNSIIGFAEILEGKAGEGFTDTAKTEYAGLIHKSANHLLSILNDLLDASKLEAGKFEISPERFSIEEETKLTLDMIRPLAHKAQVDLELIANDEMPEVFADMRATRQITLNLVANAIKFSKHSGKVSVSLSRTARNLVLKVSDNGIGMDDVTLQNLGTMFFQANQSNEDSNRGTGLGLSIVKGLVDLHGGSIGFESNLGEGTDVTVTLPLNYSGGGAMPADPDSSIVFLDAVSKKSDTPFNMQRVRDAG